MPKQKKLRKTPEKKGRIRKENLSDGKEEIFLGTLDSSVVGLQYHHARAVPGEEVYLEREPENSHDPRAVRVDNRDFHALGYLPRKDAAWLAPLLDRGLILGDALIPHEGSLTEQKAPLEIRIFASSKGEGLLKQISSCTNPEEGLRNLLLHAWQMGQTWEDPRMIRDVAEKLRSLVDRSSLSESHLYLRLLEGQEKRAEELGKKRLEEAFCGLTLEGDPKRWKNYTIFWFSSSGALADSEGEELLLLEEALAEGSALISEVSSEGSVPELRVTNRGARPILLLEGELLEGGKQHRVLRVTLVVSPGEERIISVCCVEQGRWDNGGTSFGASSFAPPSVRQRSNLSGNPLRASRAQGEVWQEVQDLLCSRGVNSSTGSLLEGYEEEASPFEQFMKDLAAPPEALGCLIFRGTEMMGMDVLESPKAFSALWPRMAEGYFLASSGELSEKTSEKPEREDAERVRRHVGEALETLRKDEKHPFRYTFENAVFQGHGVFYGNRIRHFAAFTQEMGRREEG